MKINLTLFKSKTLADGTHPIMVSFAHGGKTRYIATGERCSERQWNKTRREVNSKDPNQERKNKIIVDVLLKYQNRLKEIMDLDIEPSFEIMMSDDKVETAKRTDTSNFIWIFSEKSKSSKAPRTQKEYLTFKKVLESLYGSYIDVDAIDQKFVDELRRKIDEHYGEMNAQKNHFIKCFLGAYSYASEMEYVKIPRLLKMKNFLHIKGETDLTNEQVSIIINAYKKDVVAQSRELDKRHKEALCLFCLMIAFQGLSNIDLATLKVGDLSFSTVKKIDVDIERYHNDSEYKTYVDSEQDERDVVIVSTKRRKTEVPVKIVCDSESIEPILEVILEGKSQDDYLINCFSKRTEGNAQKEIERCAAFFNQRKKKLKEYLDEYCEIWSYTKFERITYYMARHAFINRVSNMDIAHNLIKKFVGHKEGVLERSYITPPTKWEQADVIRRIFNQGQTIKELIAERHQRD